MGLGEDGVLLVHDGEAHQVVPVQDLSRTYEHHLGSLGMYSVDQDLFTEV